MRTGQLCYQLRQLRPVVRCSSEDAAKTMVQAFVISRLDYCNTMCYGITDELTPCMQSVQKATARLVTGTRRCDHISPVLLCGSASCSRLRVSSTGPCLATPRVTWPTTVRQLRSANTRTVVVSRTRSSFGDRTFATAGPQVWSSPPNLRLCGLSYGQFQAVTEDLFIPTVRPRRTANITVFNCAE